MPTDPMWCFENYGEAAEYIDHLEKQRNELLAALRVFADKYNSAPDGDLGIGLVNGDFFRAIDAITKSEAP